MSKKNDILVFCEVTKGEISVISTEALGCGRSLADDLGVNVNAVIAGKSINRLAADAIAYGADKVFVVDNPLLQNYQTETFLSVFEKLSNELTPDVIIMGQTSIGRDMAPALAARLDAAATLDCVDLAVDSDTKQLHYTKPVYGGNAWAVYATECKPHIATIRAKAMQPIVRDENRSGETVSFDMEIDMDGIKTKLLEKVPEQVNGIRLEDARVVIGGGRGIGSIENFAKLEELAEMFKGAVGASRAVCDNGWLPSTMQIGLTGRVVTPELYFAIGISGASQHMAGCSGATNIIAINNDDGANIFREAHYGVLGDWQQVIAGFINKIKELNA
ncbi:MAG: electron transfer flavoprotein subunit alpha/FixB family protein [Pseudomonadota bacterium]